MMTSTEQADQGREYQVWAHSPSGERYGVRLRRWAPAEERAGAAADLSEEQYEASLIDGACGPLYGGTGHEPITEIVIGDLNYSGEDVEWLQAHAFEFGRVDPFGTNVCMLCHEAHQAEEA